MTTHIKLNRHSLYTSLFKIPFRLHPSFNSEKIESLYHRYLHLTHSERTSSIIMRKGRYPCHGLAVPFVRNHGLLTAEYSFYVTRHRSTPHSYITGTADGGVLLLKILDTFINVRIKLIVIIMNPMHHILYSCLVIIRIIRNMPCGCVFGS